MDNWHDEQARRHQRDADAHWMAGTAGSSEQWGSASMAQFQRQQAEWQRESEARPPWALALPSAAEHAGGFHASVGAWGAPSAPRDSSQIGAVVWGLARALTLWALGLGLLVGALWLGAVQAQRHWAAGRPGGGLGRLAAQMAFPGVDLSPAARYLGAALAPLPPPAGGRKPTARKLVQAGEAAGAEAYRCLLDLACASARPGNPDATLWRAAGFLAGRARAGDEAAAGDLCLLPMLAGSTGGSAERSAFACAAALRAAPGSAVAARRARVIASSWWVGAASFLGPLIER